MTLEELQAGQVICINKPLDWTSFDVVNKIRWKIKKEFNVKKIKVGHAGTLDPKATGLLIVCTGKATKTIQQIQNQFKVYTGTLKLGATTTCFDTELPEDLTYPTEHITKEKIQEATKQFIGEDIPQVPPIYSAINKNGKKLYDLARKGTTVVPEARLVTIYNFDILKIEMPYVYFKVKCAKGTYIRSLANDFGKALDSGAYLTALHREQIGDYIIDDQTENWLS